MYTRNGGHVVIPHRWIRTKMATRKRSEWPRQDEAATGKETKWIEEGSEIRWRGGCFVVKWLAS